MNLEDDKITNGDDDDDDDESIWAELLHELTVKHGDMPKYLYKAISESSESSTASASSETLEEVKGTREEQAGDSLSSPEVHRRSPGVDSGCSVGFIDDDYEDEETRRDTSIKKIKKELHAMRETTVSLAKQFIYAFDIIEDIKYMNETTSSRESLSSNASGSQEFLSPIQRQKRYHLRKFSRSVPNARGACPELISRHHRKKSEEVRLRLFEDNFQDVSLDKGKAASTDERINQTVARSSPRRASDDTSTMSPRKLETLHRRSSSLSYGEKKEDQWMQNILDFDEQHRSTLNFVELLRAQNDEMSNYFQFEGLPKDNDDSKTHVEHDPAVDVDDISVEVDNVLESQSQERIDLDAVSDKYDIQNDGSGPNNALQIDTVCNEKSDIQKDEMRQPSVGGNVSGVNLDKYPIQERETVQPKGGTNGDPAVSNDNCGTEEDNAISTEEEHPSYNASQSPLASPSLVNGESPRKSWLHGDGRSSYNERREMTTTETVVRRRSRSLHNTETNVSDEDEPQKQEQNSKSHSTQPKKMFKKLQRSPTYHGTKRPNERSPPKKEDASFSNPISPRYMQLLLMLEEGDATDL